MEARREHCVTLSLRLFSPLVLLGRLSDVVHIIFAHTLIAADKKFSSPDHSLHAEKNARKQSKPNISSPCGMRAMVQTGELTVMSRR